MRAFSLMVLTAMLAACAPKPAPQAPAADRATQQQACLAAVAKHVGKPESAVTTAFTGTDPQGNALFSARDGKRVHICTVDPAGRVLQLQHPKE